MIDFEFEFQYAEEKQPALQKIGGSIPAGRCVVLCGGSGCGKSTLLRCINGLIPQFYEGELKDFCLLNGQDTAGMRIGEIGELAASVFQDPRSQFFTVNSSNEVAFGLENHGLPQCEIRRRVDDTLSGVSFSVREHEIVGLVGANGCGKTTIGKLAALRNLHLPERLIMIVAVIFFPGAVRGYEAAAAIHPHPGRVCDAASKAAGAAVVFGNSDGAYGAAGHPYCRDAVRLR